MVKPRAVGESDELAGEIVAVAFWDRTGQDRLRMRVDYPLFREPLLSPARLGLVMQFPGVAVDSAGR